MNGNALLCHGGQRFNRLVHFRINEKAQHMTMGGNNIELLPISTSAYQSGRVCLSIWISYLNEYELSVQPLLWALAMLRALKTD